MGFTGKGESGNFVHLLRRQVGCGRVLHHIASVHLLAQSFGTHGVVVVVKQVKHLHKHQRVFNARIKARQRKILFFGGFGHVAQPPHRLHTLAFFQGLSKLHHAVICHAIEQIIRLRIQNERTAQFI